MRFVPASYRRVDAGGSREGVLQLEDDGDVGVIDQPELQAAAEAECR